MKKLTAFIIVGTSVISLSAHANPPLADGSWVGSYTTSYPACGGSGKAILIQKDARHEDNGVTVFSGTLILENFQPGNSYPDYNHGVGAKTKIIYSAMFGYPGSALINQGNLDCKYVFQQAGNYDDAKKEIKSLTNGNCGCRIDISELRYQPTVSKSTSIHKSKKDAF